MQSIYSKPGHLIRRAQQIAVAIFMEEVSFSDVTPVQYAALRAIESNPGADATRLSALIAFDRSTLGNVLERLEKKALIVRSNSSEDRRIKVLHLTPAGAKLLEAIEPAVERAQERILSPLTPAEQDQFVKLINKLIKMNGGASRHFPKADRK